MIVRVENIRKMEGVAFKDEILFSIRFISLIKYVLVQYLNLTSNNQTSMYTFDLRARNDKTVPFMYFCQGIE